MVSVDMKVPRRAAVYCKLYIEKGLLFNRVSRTPKNNTLNVGVSGDGLSSFNCYFMAQVSESINFRLSTGRTRRQFKLMSVLQPYYLDPHDSPNLDVWMR
jgi:hypothetical protein